MRVNVKKWGNSASVRIPAPLMRAARIEVDDPVDVREEGGRIIIEPVREGECSLEELVTGITPENRHDEVDWGARVGKEAW